MWSIWNAPSDRDYYGCSGSDDQDDEPEYCFHCGARWDQACEEWCCTNASASEPAPAESGQPTAYRTRVLARCIEERSPSC